jgi:hypothetical protein
VKPILGVTMLLTIWIRASALAQSSTDSSVTMGNAPLKLGMQQDQVVARLSASGYDFDETSGIVFSGSGTYRRAIGSLLFKEGVLRRISSDWGPSNQQGGVPLANALFGVMSEFVNEGRRICYLSVLSNRTPTGESHTVSLTCSGKRAEVGVILDNQYGNYASVTEEIGDLP